MTPFSYHKPASLDEAVSLAGPSSRLIAGGTNLVDLMKENVERPEPLIDITGLALKAIPENPQGGVMTGSLGRTAGLAWHPVGEPR